MNTLIIALIIVTIYYFYFLKAEHFSEDNDSDMNFARSIQIFIQPGTVYSSYVEFLLNNNNTYTLLHDFKTFTSLKDAKKLGKLSIEYISQYMK